MAVVNLTLIDLPGLTKVAVGMYCIWLLVMNLIFELDIFVPYWLKILFFAEGQPETIVEDIENMVRSYVEKVIMHFFSLKNAKYGA